LALRMKNLQSFGESVLACRHFVDKECPFGNLSWRARGLG
jgi:hypothetical protein